MFNFLHGCFMVENHISKQMFNSEKCCAAGETDPDVSYTDVTIVPEVQPKSDKGKNTCRALFPHVHKSLRHMYVIYMTSVFPFCGKL